MACCCCCDCTRCDCEIESDCEPCFLGQLKESNESIKRLLFKLDDLSDSLKPNLKKNYFKESNSCKKRLVNKKVDRYELCQECEKLIASKADLSNGLFNIYFIYFI